MLVDLQRAFTPEEMEEYEGALCRRDYRPASVIAFAQTNERAEIGRICPECLEYFGRVNPGLFPTVEDYREALQRYPAPMGATSEEAGRAEDEGFDPYDAAFVWKAPA